MVQSGRFRFLGALLALMMLLGVSTTAFAQATPEASPTGSGSGPVLGDAVIILDVNGNELAQMAVTQVVDPYTDADDADRGFHWVAIEVVVQNTGDSDFEPNIYDLMLLDDLGFASSPGYAPREDDIEAAQPEFLGDSVPDGETASGWLFYQVIDDAIPTQVVYAQPYGDGSFTLLANLGGEIAAEGAETTFYFGDASEAGTIAINEIVPQFEDVESGIDVDRGQSVLALDVTITNTGESDLEPDLYGLLVVDEFGVTYTQSYLFRDDAESSDYPDFTTDPIAPGDSAQGTVFFEVPADAQVSYVIFAPESGLLYILAQPGAGSMVSGETLTPVAVEVTPDDDDTGSTGGEETGDCVGVADWAASVDETLGAMDSELDFLDGELADTDPADIRAGAEAVGSLKADLENIEVPAAAQATHDAMVTLLKEFETLFIDVADRLDAGEDAASIEESLSDPSGPFFEAFTVVTDELTALTEACPDSGLENFNF
jgi:hypothetical protein